MAYSGPTRDGPRVCLHNAPIDATCVDCARERCEAYTSHERRWPAGFIINDLDTLAKMGQTAKLVHGRIVATERPTGIVYAIRRVGQLTTRHMTRSRSVCLKAIERPAIEHFRA